MRTREEPGFVCLPCCLNVRLRRLDRATETWQESRHLDKVLKVNRLLGSWSSPLHQSAASDRDVNIFMYAVRPSFMTVNVFWKSIQGQSEREQDFIPPSS